MNALSQYTKLCMDFTVVHTHIAKKLDGQLSIHGINFSEFMILFHLERAPEMKMRRIDLAGKIGLSASGITRLVNPMEKIGLVHKEANKRDARVSLVKLSAAGQRILQESGLSLDATTPAILSNLDEAKINGLLEALKLLGGTVDYGIQS